MRILNFGSCNIDTVYSVKHIVQAGETLGISSLNQFPGGKGLNQSIALARAGVKVYHAGCVGKEDMILIPLMQKAGIDVVCPLAFAGLFDYIRYIIHIVLPFRMITLQFLQLPALRFRTASR